MTALQLRFRELVTPVLDRHPDIAYEWRDIRSWWWGNRIDLVCGVGSAHEVYASLSDGQITVGIVGGEHDDFEDFGRGLSDQAIAQEALVRFLGVLAENGLIEPDAGNNET